MTQRSKTVSVGALWRVTLLQRGGVLLALAVVLAAPFALPAFAMSLNEARSQGAVCETTDGLLRATGGSGDVSKLVSDTNAQRMQSYRTEAQKQGVPVADVQAISGAQLRARYTPCR